MDRERSISKNHYFNKEYLKKERFYSFAEQIDLVKQYAGAPDSILEIGKGSGYVSEFLKKYAGYNLVRTMDVNDKLNPDIVADISETNVGINDQYDIIICFEVLEHMSFERAIQAVNNMREMAKKYIIISVPDMRYFISLRGTIFGTGPIFINKLFSTPRIRNKFKKFGKDHHWEIGLNTQSVKYSPDYIKLNLFNNSNVIRDYRDIAVPWHHYYVLKMD